jgi:DNA helicase II / ATP-dependent DNA helicase PcrA
MWGNPHCTVLRGGIDGNADLLPDRTTFVVEVEEGLVPHYRARSRSGASPAADDALEEELRAFYVALTRARDRLFLSACTQRSPGDRIEVRQPSRWLHALPADLLAAA